MKYKLADMGNQPEWLENGPVWCRCSFRDNSAKAKRVIVWYNDFDGIFYDNCGQVWDDAEPIPVWEPKHDEPVLTWSVHSLDHAVALVLPYWDAKKGCHTNVIAKIPSPFTTLNVGKLRAMDLEKALP